MIIKGSPWQLLEDISKNYPQLDGVEVWFADGPKDSSMAYVQFYKDGSKPRIHINPILQLTTIPEILAHEMAHIIVGQAKDHNDDHNDAWVDAFAKLLKEMNTWMRTYDKEFALK